MRGKKKLTVAVNGLAHKLIVPLDDVLYTVAGVTR